MVVSVPGEMTVEMGRRVRAAVMKATADHGINDVVISGLANEYKDYFATPQEYDMQHYEGAATVYGRTSSDALQTVLVELSADLVNAKPAPAPYAYNPTNGIGADADAAPFSSGATSARVGAQPDAITQRLGRPTFWWHGGLRGFDRPLDSAFILVERRVGGAWQIVDSDLGRNMLWTVDKDGLYRAEWEVPLDAPAGAYRFAVHANHYQLTSDPFTVEPAQTLTVSRASGTSVRLDYPAPVSHEAVRDPPGDYTADLTWRPKSADAGRVTFLVDGKAQTVAAGSDGTFTVKARPGARVEVQPGAAQDANGNANRNDLQFSA